MFLLLFPPAATGWLASTDDAESIEGVMQPGGKWVHTTARATVAATLPAPSKEIGSSKMIAACGPVGDWWNGAPWLVMGVGRPEVGRGDPAWRAGLRIE